MAAKHRSLNWTKAINHPIQSNQPHWPVSAAHVGLYNGHTRPSNQPVFIFFKSKYKSKQELISSVMDAWELHSLLCLIIWRGTDFLTLCYKSVHITRFYMECTLVGRIIVWFNRWQSVCNCLLVLNISYEVIPWSFYLSCLDFLWYIF